MNDKQVTGQEGEQIAVDYLLKNDFVILHTNWRQGHKEVDIVAEKEGRLHIVEVRTLNSSFFMQPYQSINKAKQRNLISAADAYVKRYNLTVEVQIDVISIVFNGAEHKLEYIPNAIYPML